MVFQDFRLFPDFTVYENVAFAQRVVEADKKVMKRRVMEVLSQVGSGREGPLLPIPPIRRGAAEDRPCPGSGEPARTAAGG